MKVILDQGKVLKKRPSLSVWNSFFKIVKILFRIYWPWGLSWCSWSRTCSHASSLWPMISDCAFGLTNIFLTKSISTLRLISGRYRQRKKQGKVCKRSLHFRIPIPMPDFHCHSYIWRNDKSNNIILTRLRNTQNGNLMSRLKKIIDYAIKHVNSCALCKQKGNDLLFVYHWVYILEKNRQFPYSRTCSLVTSGFICEQCGDGKVIYPFEMESTWRCDKCGGVYHKACRPGGEGGGGTCMKCERIRKRRVRRGERHQWRSKTSSW